MAQVADQSGHPVARLETREEQLVQRDGDHAGEADVERVVVEEGDAEQGGGGWPWILAGLKTYLETGRQMVGSGS